MAVDPQLTEGAIAKITAAAEFKPTVQVTELKQLQTNPPQHDDRFRVVLSDGAHLQQAILDPQINHLVKDGNLRSGSVVQLVQYPCTSIEGRKIIIIRELIVVAEECAIIGKPISAQRPSGSVQPSVDLHFLPVSDIESMDNNTVVDVIGVVSSIAPTASVKRKNGTETQKRTLQLKDMSGRSVELILWGNFCCAEGQRLQNLCNSGGFPVLAVKFCSVSEFNGKAVETNSKSQLFIDPDFPEAHGLKEWFERKGRSMPSVSISREVPSTGRMNVLKTVSQIKDEKLGTSEKPDWITVNATVKIIKDYDFCYPACPIMVGDRPCSEKVTNNGDGKWWCEKCDQSVDECDYRYKLQFQIQDHTGFTWVIAFQECGAEIMGISAKDLHYMKHEDQDDEGFSKILRRVLSTRYIFKLKVKEETYNDKQHVKCTVVKAEKVNYSSHSRFLGQMEKFKLGDGTSSALAAEACYSNAGMDSAGFGDGGAGSNSIGKRGYAGGELGQPANQVGQYGNEYSTGFPASGASTSCMSCSSCGATGHSSTNCPSIMSAPGQSMRGTYGSRVSPGASYSGASGECFKCHQVGHWARDCPGLTSVPPAYGNSSMSSGRFGGMSK